MSSPASSTSLVSPHLGENPFVNPATGTPYGLEEEEEDHQVDNDVDNFPPTNNPLTLESVARLTRDEEDSLGTNDGVHDSPAVAPPAWMEETWAFAALPPAAANEAAEEDAAGAAANEAAEDDVAGAGAIVGVGVGGLGLLLAPVAANNNDDDNDNNEAILDGLVANFQAQAARGWVEPRHLEENREAAEAAADLPAEEEEDADEWRAPDDYMSEGEEEEEGEEEGEEEDEGAAAFVWENLPATAAVERLRAGFEALAGVRGEVDALDVANEGVLGPGRGDPAAVRARAGLLLAGEELTAAFRMQLETTDWLRGALALAHQGREREEGRRRALTAQVGLARYEAVAAQAEAAQLRFELAAARRQLDEAGRDP
ncbi:hypothetical protein RBB50_005219 [Rhinocladiella similis]